VALLVVAGGIGMASSAVRETHVPMAFLPGGGGALEPVPFQACFTRDGGFFPVPLGRQGIGQTLPAGATLAWRVRVGEPPAARQGLRAWFAPERYYVAQVMVSERSRAKVIVPRRTAAGPVEVPAGEAWEWGWKLNDRAESNALVLLARGDRPFDPDALRAALLERFPAAAAEDPAAGALDVTAVSNFIAAQAPGSVIFVVQTVEDEDRCNR